MNQGIKFILQCRQKPLSKSLLYIHLSTVVLKRKPTNKPTKQKTQTKRKVFKKMGELVFMLSQHHSWSKTSWYSYIFVTLNFKDKILQVKYGNDKQRIKITSKLINGYANRKYYSHWGFVCPIAKVQGSLHIGLVFETR